VAVRARIEFEGIVQGVGFRPFLHRLAEESGLSGWVLNSSAGVLMELEGERPAIEEYVRRVREDGPPLSRVLVARVRYLAPLGFQGFTIRPSRKEENALTLLCPDVATCSDCLRELFDPADRRFCYPFINCTNCGPRYTIVRSLPYDRPQTTMAGFPLCPACEAEYRNVEDRRYHAQPVACAECGPTLWFETPEGERLSVDTISHAAGLLRDGKAVALKGLGGFHVACRADSDEAVLGLRRRKQRSFFKPLAVMLPSIDVARELCEVSGAAEEWLVSHIRPIVLLPLKPGAVPGKLSAFVAPNLDRLGVMLPYTPLHHLLLAETGLPLVMTSGNLSDEPIVADNDEARTRLSPLVDGLLLHDRPIHARCDDSVLTADDDGSCAVLRQARGFSPYPLALPEDGPSVLALGGDIKTTFAASRGHFVFVSPHLGDAEHLGTYSAFRETWEHYRTLFDLRPEAVACDMHPGYHTARWAEELAAELRVPLLQVQHHHAHLAALLAETGLRGPLPAIVADGTGYGTDGTTWGGELLYGDEAACERLAHLRTILLPGGDAAAREPWHIALSLLHVAAPERMSGYADDLLSGRLAERARGSAGYRVSDEPDPSYSRPRAADVRLVLSMLAAGVNLAPSSALGRLFDGIAALLGVTLRATYEAQAPMELEALLSCGPDPGAPEALPVVEGGVVDWAPFIQALARDPGDTAGWAWRFHHWVAQAFLASLAVDARAAGSSRVLASGGCMLNNTLRRLLRQGCAARGLSLVVHRDVPPGDGGLSLGVLRVAQAHVCGSAQRGGALVRGIGNH
jgi:hydrogenase maturation protein HypF